MKNVKKPIAAELDLFEKKFAESVRSKNPLLDRIMRFIIRRKGKQMRPMFVFLAAKISGGVTDSTYRASSLIELLHTATLVHDDVVDDANMRRSFFSVNALWKNKVAVLVGDYLLSKGLLLSLENDDFQILKIVSTAVKEMSEGELLQIEKTRKLDIKEDIYFEIIRSKTASLLASACSAGAWSATGDPETAKLFHTFGEKIGISFQIKDDLFDYGHDNIGKPTGIDIKEKKMTLPLIYTLQHVDEATKRKIIYIVKNQNKDKHKVNEVIEIVKQHGGIAYAHEKMMQYQAEAMEVLHRFPESEARNAMEELVQYVTERRY
ncbi:polyprenyl synthetase family protein [Taibaiella chishuiensis]|uniref:Octaprenyl-diphosphate synthase n=1 Tax=Taibaiella chishuiensis TaxID=1434707 RepID=A0A2P8DC46_9BACT|nr:polyprenyl synthetase family protein [Taibaiella chishuiensis]PSK94792.1 octaprenyl-diphosphate synthase [Taibaiella chishuiensis]